MSIKTHRIVSNDEFINAKNNPNNTKIIHKVANKYSQKLDRHDIISLKDESLWLALRDFNSQKKCKFTTYLYHMTKWTFTNFLKKNENKIQFRSMKFDPQIKAEQYPEFREIPLVHKYYYEKKTLKEIAIELNISIETVRNRLNQIKKKMFEEMLLV